MLLDFPTLDALRFALSAGLLPVEAAMVSGDVTGPLTIELPGRFTKDLTAKLNPFGIAAVKSHRGETRSIANVLELFDLVSVFPTPEITPQTPVLFHIQHASDLPTISRELLRLGNDRQSYCIIDEEAFLKVLGPPVYTMLRATDASHDDIAMTALVEASPRVWVRAGYAHPFAKSLTVPESQVLLLSPNQPWRRLKTPTFQDIYEAAEFEIAAPESFESSTTSTINFTVPLRLTPGNATDVPEMWVLGEDALGQLDRFVRDCDAKLLEQLLFCVADSESASKTVLLRSRPGVKTPPVLTLEVATAYRPYWRLPNLFLPAGTRLQPQIRRDAVTKLLADDPDRLVWLSPGEAGAFTPRSVAENQFRPLTNWIDYVIDANAESLTAWMGATVFEFDAFICAESPSASQKQSVETEKSEKPSARKVKPMPQRVAESLVETDAVEVAPLPTVAVVKREPSQWKLRCDQLEKEFLAVEGPLDHPRRIELWGDLAEANDALGADRQHEAALCRWNAAWERVNERESLTWPVMESHSSLETLVQKDDPTPAEMRAFAGGILNAKSIANLPNVQRYFEANDDRMPVRAAWLVALKLAKLGGDDVLGLARCRDRLLAQLLERGLSPERDVPAFLRFAGVQNSDQARLVRDRLPELRSLVRQWVDAGELPNRQVRNGTAAYCDLIFAYALATLGDTTAVYGLVEAARTALEKPDGTDDVSKVSTFLFRGFKYRIDEALAGRPPAGPLSRELQVTLQAWLHGRFHEGKVVHNPVELAVNRLREESSILEPQYRLDPYGATLQGTSELTRFLAQLSTQRESPSFSRTYREAFTSGIKPHSLLESRLYLLHDVVSLAPAIGMDFTLEVLTAVPEVLAGLSTIESKLDFGLRPGRLTAQALLLSVHYERPDLVPLILDRYSDFLRSLLAGKRFESVNIMAADALRVLHRIGNRDLLGRFLQQLQAVVLDDVSIHELQKQYSHRPHEYATVLQSALLIAAGWMRLERTGEAMPILDGVRSELLSTRFTGFIAAQAALAKAYLNALSHAPVELALERIVDFFSAFDARRIADSQSTAAHYYRFQLLAVENAVMALVGGDSKAGSEGRHFMNEDEQIVRRRIISDFQRLKTTQGL